MRSSRRVTRRRQVPRRAALLARDPDRPRVSAVPGADARRPGAALLGSGRQGLPPRREPARVLLVVPVRRPGLHPRPDDARAAAVRAERAGLLAVRRQRLHGAPGAGAVRRGDHRPAVLPAPRARPRGRDRRRRAVRHLARVPVLLALHPPRHLRRLLHAADGHRRVPLPGDRPAELVLHGLRRGGAAVRDQGRLLHQRLHPVRVPARQLVPAARRAARTAFRSRRPRARLARLGASGWRRSWRSTCCCTRRS